jgi:DNA integrity scanning protein DisA with diadenylate cyclase activity
MPIPYDYPNKNNIVNLIQVENSNIVQQRTVISRSYRIENSINQIQDNIYDDVN